MATAKPIKPDVILPDNFGGIKTPYSEAQIRDGYLQGVPEIVDGGNINYEKDALFQKIKYCETIADVINGILPNNTIAVDSNNRFIYTTQVQMATDAEFQAGTSKLKVPNVKQTKTESERILSIVGNKVNKSGDTMTGNLIINGNIPAYILQSSTLDLSQKFTDNKSDALFAERDKNGIEGSYILFKHDIHDTNAIEFVASNGVDASRKLTAMGIWIKKNGECGTYAPKCSIDNSILTTVHNELDAVFLGNGLILNWGEIAVGDDKTVPVVLKIPYSNTNYRVVFGHNNQAAGRTDFYHPQIMYTTKTTTGFSIYNRNAGSYHLSNVAWFAIGR